MHATTTMLGPCTGIHLKSQNPPQRQRKVKSSRQTNYRARTDFLHAAKRKQLGGYRPFGVATITASPWDGDR